MNSSLMETSIKMYNELAKQKNSFALLRAIQNQKLNDIQYFIPIGKDWRQQNNKNNFILEEDGQTYQIIVSSTIDGRFLAKNIFNGISENQNNLISSWSTVENDSNAFIQIIFSKPKAVNALLIKTRFKRYDQSPIYFEIFGLESQETEPKSLGQFIEKKLEIK